MESINRMYKKDMLAEAQLSLRVRAPPNTDRTKKSDIVSRMTSGKSKQ